MLQIIVTETSWLNSEISLILTLQLLIITEKKNGWVTPLFVSLMLYFKADLILEQITSMDSTIYPTIEQTLSSQKQLQYNSYRPTRT